MKVSIITVVYNNVDTVAQVVQSVLKQDYENIEYIVIDGESDDGTLSILEEYEEQIDVFISELDKGIYNAMNKGIKVSSGDIIGILNSDDIYYNDDVISKVVKFFENNNTDGIYGDLQYVGQDYKKVLRNWKAGPYKKNHFKKGWMPPHPAFFVKKQIYDKYGVFDESFKIAADYELMLRFFYKYQVEVSYLSETLVKMRLGGVSNRSLKNRYIALKEDYRAWNVNDLQPKFYTIPFKKLSKIKQYFI